MGVCDLREACERPEGGVEVRSILLPAQPSVPLLSHLWNGDSDDASSH